MVYCCVFALVFISLLCYQLVKDNDLPVCVKSSMYFWTHTKWESESIEHSKRNSREAQEITKVAKTFCQEGGIHPSKITVLCSYRGQVNIYICVFYLGLLTSGLIIEGELLRCVKKLYRTSL